MTHEIQDTWLTPVTELPTGPDLCRLLTSGEKQEQNDPRGESPTWMIIDQAAWVQMVCFDAS